MHSTHKIEIGIGIVLAFGFMIWPDPITIIKFGGLAVGLILIAWGVIGIIRDKRKKSCSDNKKTPHLEKKLTLRRAAEYIANNAAITVPNKKIPFAHFPLTFAALYLQDEAKIGSITVLARERGQGSFKKIEPEAWETIEFDWATLLDRSRNDLMSETKAIKLPDTPKVPDIVDLRFFKDEIEQTFPRQTLLEKRSRKRFRKKHGTR